MPRMEDMMEDSTFTIDQVGKLREIERARLKRDEPGLRSDLQALIMRLQSGGVGPQSDDPRVVQAKRLYDKGFGLREGGFPPHGNWPTFDAYLATIPEIPEELKANDKRFPELVLVDTRIGIVKTCELLCVDFDGNDQTFEDFDPNKAKTDKVYWIRAQDGRKNNGKSIKTCRKQFTDAGDELGLTDHEGLALFAQNPEGLRGRAMDLPSSVGHEGRGSAACLSWFYERPRLDWRWPDTRGRSDHYGSASCREHA